MNNPRLVHTRLVCAAVRRWEASFGPARGLTGTASRHREGCEDCREFFTEDAGLERTLRDDAARLRNGISDTGLERRLLRAVTEAGRAAKHEPRREPSPVWGRALLASACAALAVIFWQKQPEAGPEAPVASAVEPAREAVAGSPPAGAPELGAWRRALDAGRAGLALAEKNPLEREIESVRMDARAVIGFLSLNFLPTKPAPERSPAQG